MVFNADGRAPRTSVSEESEGVEQMFASDE
jgi:hypothetical protein